MNYIDIIIIVLVLIGFILGYKDGLVRKIIGLIGLIAALILVFEFSETVGEILAPVFNDEIYLAEFISGILIFFLTILFFSALKRLIHPVDKVNRIVNQLLGGASGVLQMLFFLSGIFLFLNLFKVPNQDTRNSSLFYSQVYSVIPKSVDFILGSDSNTKEIIKEYIESKDDFVFPSDSNKTKINDSTLTTDSTETDD